MRGSRKHVLDWTGSPEFKRELRDLLADTGCEVDGDSLWAPVGHESPDEAILDSWGPRAAPAMANWSELAKWWLVHRRGANRPNWDLVVSCSVRGQPGLVLFEAKAHESELDCSGKKLALDCSCNSRENHERIGQAIEEAQKSFKRLDDSVGISRDSHYQLSNRLAFSWKLSQMGVPNLLVYLGFIGDEGMAGAGRKPFQSQEHWEQVATTYLSSVFPSRLVDVWHSFGEAETRLILRSRQILELSPASIP